MDNERFLGFLRTRGGLVCWRIHRETDGGPGLDMVDEWGYVGKLIALMKREVFSIGAPSENSQGRIGGGGIPVHSSIKNTRAIHVHVIHVCHLKLPTQLDG